MFGLLVIIAVYLILGFLLAWVAGVVAKEDVSVTTGVIVLIVFGMLSFLAELGLEAIAPDAAWIAQPPINFAIFTLAIHLIAKLTLKHSAIIAAIYTAVIFVIGFAITGCVAATA